MIIAGYQVDKLLYESADSLIYRTQRHADRFPVILKLLKDDYPPPEKLARFRREYELTRRLQQLAGVIQVSNLDTYQQTLFMVLEDFGGESLANILNNRQLELPEFLRLTNRLAGIVGHIHQQRIIHKDINPSNIIWNPQTDQLKIIDFGISSELSREQPKFQHPNVLEGTLAYMSPEQTGRMNRVVDYRTDLYSLGVTFYHLLTGQPPFQTQDVMELVHCHLAKMPLPPCEISAPGSPAEMQAIRILSDIIMKLLAKNAEHRYQSTYGLRYDLEFVQRHISHLTSHISHIVLAQHDLSDHFQIPQKLYGREHEIQTLLQIFAQVETTGKSSLLLVTGYAGIGKSALVQEIYKPITKNRGTFIAGKFDQFTRNIPYFAIIQAFQAFVRQVLTEPEERVAVWKEQFLNVLGSNGQIVIEMIPDIALIIGPQPEVPKLPPDQAQNRFNFVLQNFARVCATREHPLVIFLDDLQWTDSSSLNLLDLLLTDPNMQFMLIIGAYRDNEVNDAHPLMLKLNNIRKVGVSVNTIALTPLALEQVNQLIVDTLHVIPPRRTALPLAELSLRKTGGNPFFLRQFLQTLYDEKFLTFHVNKREWKWTLEDIQQAQMTDNVVELMVSKLQKLPQETQNVLTLAACIGNRFDLQTLSTVHEHSPAEILHKIWDALQEDFIIPLDDSYKYIEVVDTPNTKHQTLNTSFKFLHDRIQQAAYALIEEGHKQQVHLKIGRLMLEKIPEVDRDEKIFEIVNHLNIGKDLLTEQSEKDNAAQLNLLTGKKAKHSAAYQPTFEYLQTGIVLLHDESWQQQYDLTLALYTEAAEAAYLIGEFEQMEQLIEIVLQHARTLLDKVKIYTIKIDALKSQNKPVESLRIGFSVLELLGVTFPKRPNKVHILWDLLKTKLALFGKSIEALANLPEMVDPYALAAMRIMESISTATAFALPEMVPLLGFETLQLSLKHGNAPTSIYFYAGYGAFNLCGSQGDIDSGYRFGKLALGLLEKFNVKKIKARTLGLVSVNIIPWKVHVRETFPLLLEAYQSALETGEFEYAAFSVYTYSYHSYFIGHELAKLEREIALYSDVICRLRQETAHHCHNIHWQAVLNLMGKADTSSSPWWLVGKAYDEEKMLSLHLQANDKLTLLKFHINKLLLCYLFQAYPQAVKHARLAERHLIGAVTASIFTPLFHFYDSLARLAVYPHASKPEQRQTRKKVTANQKKMKKWAFHAPMNFLHKWYLVEAERMRVLGKDAEAMNYYDKAIEGARENEYLNEEALANEVAARFYLAKGKEKIAQVYMSEAHYCYLKWGATAKVRHLEEHYPQFFSSKDAKDRHLIDAVTDTAHVQSTTLDFSTILKASQAVLSEVRVNILIEKILLMMLENAGAQRGLFLEPIHEQFVIRAKAEAGEVSILSQPESEGFRQDLPYPILHYVTRSRETMVFDDLSADKQYASDSYIQTHQPKSALCIPVVSKEAVSAIVYLENNLSTGAFTPDRLEVLHILSSQAAISLENASFYATLEQKVKQRTAELEQEIVERKRAEEAANIANIAKNHFLGSISHELRTPLNAILGYAQLLRHEQGLTEKLREAVATIHRSGEHLLLLLNDLLDMSKIEAGKIELKPHNFPLPQFLKNLAENARVRAQQKAILLETDISPDIPAVVYGDEVRLRQILLNLLNNAINYTEKGRVTLRILDSGCEILDCENSQTPPPKSKISH